jgi:hypothetical protein
MANRSYLCCSNKSLIYPSGQQKRYLVGKQTLAADVQHVPLLWWALFRKNDLHTETFMVEGEEHKVSAPVCTKDKALEQLPNAVPVLAKAFPEQSHLEEYVELFLSFITAVKYQFLTIEWEEVECLYPDQVFQGMANLALHGFDQPQGISYRSEDRKGIHPVTRKPMVLRGVRAASWRALLLVLTGIKSKVKAPPVHSFRERKRITDEEEWNLFKILGSSWERPVPWE